MSQNGPTIGVHQLQKARSSMILRMILGLLWCLLHLVLSLAHLWCELIQNVNCWILSRGLLRKYRDLRLGKLQYLAVVIDSVEAKSTSKVERLLCWLSSLGVKYVSLYDIEGVLKTTIELGRIPTVNGVAHGTQGFDCNSISTRPYLNEMAIEVLSYSDGKEGIVRAANYLRLNYVNGNSEFPNSKVEPKFTEADMANALKAVGSGGPEPDLMLIYGPARCHLGYPAWRLRYTEILHMGSLKYMKYGAIIKAFYEFSKKHQNYGK